MKKFEKWLKKVLLAIVKMLTRVKIIESFSFDHIKKILVIRQHNELGDMLCVVPLLRALKNSFPNATIDLISRPVNTAVMLNNPYLNKVIEYDSIKYTKAPFKIIGFIKNLRKEKYDLAVVPSTVSMSVTSDLLAYLSKSKVRIGPKNLNGIQNISGFLYNVQIDLDWRNNSLIHQTQRNLELVKKFNITTNDLSLEIKLTEGEISYGCKYFEKNSKSAKKSIGFHPGAGKFPNQWDVNRFIELIQRFQNEINPMFFVTYGPKDSEPVEKLHSVFGKEIVIIKEKSIRNVAAIIDNLDLMITNDTGVMHVAAATRVPVLSLFGPTDPIQWAPLRKSDRYILGLNGDINSISVDKVFYTALKMLG
jgi:ADP-heptose:LPS heptosyltransferase